MTIDILKHNMVYNSAYDQRNKIGCIRGWNYPSKLL